MVSFAFETHHCPNLRTNDRKMARNQFSGMIFFALTDLSKCKSYPAALEDVNQTLFFPIKLQFLISAVNIQRLGKIAGPCQCS